MDLGDLHELFAARRRLDLAIQDSVSRLDWSDSGYRRLWHFLKDAFRLATAEAKRLENHIDLLCPQTAITGQPIPEKLPVVRAAMAEGAISVDHVVIIDAALKEVPADHADRVEADLTELAR